MIHYPCMQQQHLIHLWFFNENELKNHFFFKVRLYLELGLFSSHMGHCIWELWCVSIWESHCLRTLIIKSTSISVQMTTDTLTTSVINLISICLTCLFSIMCWNTKIKFSVLEVIEKGVVSILCSCLCRQTKLFHEWGCIQLHRVYSKQLGKSVIIAKFPYLSKLLAMKCMCFINIL